MSLNTKSPTTFTSGVLITDTANSAGGARGIIPGPITPSAAFDIQSTLGGFFTPRMTTTQRLALTPSNAMIVYDTTLNSLYSYQNGAWGALSNGADLTATYIVQTADAALPNSQALGALATGLLKNTTTTGVLSIAVANTDYYPQAGAFKGNYTLNATAAYTAAATDYVINLTHTPTAAVALTLPTAAVGNLHQTYFITDGGGLAGTNNITITPATGTINGNADYVIATNHGNIGVISDGTNWWTF